MSKDTSIFYLRWLEDFEDLSNEQFGMVIRAAYGFGEPPTEPLAAQACKVITNQLKRDGEKYEEVCAARARGGRMGGRPRKEKQTENLEQTENLKVPKNLKVIEKQKVNENPDMICSEVRCSEVRCSEDNPPLCPPQGGEVSYDTLWNKDACAKSKKKATKNVKFVPPTVEEVQAYLTEKGITDVDAEAFVAFYESKGWMVGKNKMQRWRSAITTWRRNGYGQRQAPRPAPPPTLFGDMSVGTPAQKYEVPDIPAWD